MARLKIYYQNETINILKKELKINNIMRIPKLKKITLNMGVGEASHNKKSMQYAIKDLSLITGQKPMITYARKSIASFKIRQNMPIGCKVTLRNKRMYEFLDRLISIAIPRIRDFRGLSIKSFDMQGNYSVAVKEQIIFPEIRYDKIDKIRGLDITLTISSESKEHSKALLKTFNFPFKD